MGDELECPSCQRQIEIDSVFCRHCGLHVPPPDNPRRAVVTRTGNLTQPDDPFRE